MRREMLITVEGDWVTIQQGNRIDVSLRVSPKSPNDILASAISMLTMVVLEFVLPDAEMKKERGLARLLKDVADG